MLEELHKAQLITLCVMLRCGNTNFENKFSMSICRAVLGNLMIKELVLCM